MANLFQKKYAKTNNLFQSPYDSRDYKFKDLVPVGAFKIPANYETKVTPFIYDQGESSMCCAASFATIRYMQESDVENGGSGINEPFSPAFTYANRLDGEDFEGMYVRSCCKKGKEGTIPYKVLPGFYSLPRAKKLFNENKEKYLEMAKPFAINSYYQCSSREQVQMAIMQTKGVIGALNVYQCFYNPDSDGFVRYSRFIHRKSDGGHAVVLCGWMTDRSGKLWWRVQNSWGVKYGDHGRCWIPEDMPWLDNPYAVVDTDFTTKWEKYKEENNL